MKCYICDTEDWIIRKDLNKKKDVGICKNCGNIAFQISDEDIKALDLFYEQAYREPPTVGNLITTTRKLNYIKIFLKDYLKDKKGLICGDVGAATGYVCNWLRSIGHKATGCERTPSFRRFSEHYYGVPLTYDLEPKHKYDLITFYHTFEHIPRPDEVLIKHRDMLSPDGVIMVSVPEWLNELIDLSAYGNLTMENYFHENHINCFTRQSFNNLLAKCDMEIVHEDYEQYGITVLIRRRKVDEPKREMVKEKIDEIQDKIERIRKAIALFKGNKTKEALDKWPLFPDAIVRLIFDTYKKDNSRQMSEFDRVFKDYPNNIALKTAKAVILYQYNKFEEAIELFKWVCERKPHEDFLVYIAWCYDRLGKQKEALMYFDQAQKINPQKWTECSNWICAAVSKMPSWDERAVIHLQEQAVKQHGDKIKLVDPNMEDVPKPAEPVTPITPEEDVIPYTPKNQ